MKIKLSQIVNSVESLNKIVEIKLPVKVAYKVNRLINKINPELKTYNESRETLVKEYGDEQEDGSWKVVDPVKLNEFAIKLTELLEVEIEVEFEKIKIEDLGEALIEPKNMVDFLFEE